jgi:RNA polymerase sigma factor (sigma-70 family)
VDYERVVLDNLPLIDSVVRFIARRHRLSADETDELGAAIRLKLIENDYEVLRRFEGRSSVRTYLTTVIQRHFLDERIARWGKWRPSAQARRLGPIAILLDRLITRDGMSFDQAADAIAARHGAEVGREALHAIFEQLPQRAQRRFLGEEELARVAAPSGGEEAVIGALDRPDDGERIEQALAAALERLDPQDRLILKMRFQDGIQFSRISRMLGLDQKPLYRRIEEIMRVLRRELESRGVSQADVAAIVGNPASEVGMILEPEATGNAPGRPSLPR